MHLQELIERHIYIYIYMRDTYMLYTYTYIYMMNKPTHQQESREIKIPLDDNLMYVVASRMYLHNNSNIDKTDN